MSRFLPCYIVLSLAGMLGGSGCMPARMTEGPQVATPGDPQWQPDAFMEHLGFFSRPEVAGAPTGSVGYATMAQYIASRMREFGLQPAAGGAFRMVYQAPLNRTIGAFVSAFGRADTLAFYPGIEFIPDGRSDAGRVEARVLHVVPGTMHTGDQRRRAVVLPRAQASTAVLKELARTGTRLALLAGELVPNAASEPVQGMVIVQVTPAALARLLAVTPATVQRLLAGEAARAWPLRRSLRVRVIADFQPRAGAINVMGYVPGKHPRLKHELVIVCADLDGVGRAGNVPVWDLAQQGEGVAALLEVARLYSTFSQYWTFPDRSVLFAVWSGARIGHQGVQTYLRMPLWLLRQTHSVVYVGLEPEDEPEVRRLLAGQGLRLEAVTVADTSRRFVIQPPPDVQRQARSQLDWQPPAEPDRTAQMQHALRTAQALADSLNTLLVREVTVPGTFPVVPTDRLWTPDQP